MTHHFYSQSPFTDRSGFELNLVKIVEFVNCQIHCWVGSSPSHGIIFIAFWLVDDFDWLVEIVDTDAHFFDVGWYIWPDRYFQSLIVFKLFYEFRVEEYRDDDHREDASHFMFKKVTWLPCWLWQFQIKTSVDRYDASMHFFLGTFSFILIYQLYKNTFEFYD